MKITDCTTLYDITYNDCWFAFFANVTDKSMRLSHALARSPNSLCHFTLLIKKGNSTGYILFQNPDNVDTGFITLMERIGGLVMGCNTLEVVLSFDCEWPYAKPVFVLSNTMTEVPQGYEDKIFLVKGELKDIIIDLNAKGFNDLYVDGGVTIQGFLKQDLIDEMVITCFPILLGGGSPLFGDLAKALNFKVTKNEIVLNNLVQTTFLRDN